MKIRILATATVLAAAMSAPASAMISKQSISGAVNSAVPSGTVKTLVYGDTVTLYGSVESHYDANKATHAAFKVAGVDRVINRISINN